MNNFYLIGMPGCGKSTIGIKISKMLDMQFVDVDSYIVEKEKHTIGDIFKNNGEAYFRKVETECLKEISKGTLQIVSTGGGVVLFKENIDVMKNSGKIIFIDTPTENILKNSLLLGRPLLKDNKNKIYDLYNERYEKYKMSADYIYVNAGTLEDAVNKVVQYIKTEK